MVFALGLWLAHFIRFNWHMVVRAMRNVVGLKWIGAFCPLRCASASPIPPNPYAPDLIAPFFRLLSAVFGGDPDGHVRVGDAGIL